jgi:hypothetical protein
LIRLVRDKHSSFLRTFVNYGLKKFYNIGPCRIDFVPPTVNEDDEFSGDEELQEDQVEMS